MVFSPTNASQTSDGSITADWETGTDIKLLITKNMQRIIYKDTENNPNRSKLTPVKQTEARKNPESKPVVIYCNCCYLFMHTAVHNCRT